MEIILLEKVANLGALGDTVNVKSGFGRNFLIPKGKATEATPGNLARFEARRAELEKAAAQNLAAAQLRAEKIRGHGTISVGVKAGSEGRLFGSVNNADIAAAATAAGVEIARSEVRLPEGAIRQLGDYEVEVHLHTDVNAALSVSVVAE